MAFKAYLRDIKVEPDSLGIFWLGQAGFLIKTPAGKVIVVDPYLSDYVYKLLGKEHGYGFKRMTPPLFDPGDIKIDWLFASHEHGDHLDVDALQLLLKDGHTPLYTNTESARIISEAGAPKVSVHVLHKGEMHDFGEFKLIVTTADHGDLCPDALGFIFDFGFTRVYYSGDTAYNKKVLQQAIDLKPEVALLPINGAFGNLNAVEAAKLADDLGSRVCIPHHFWTFPLHNGEKGTPMDAIEAFPKFAPDCELVMRYPGEAYIYTTR
jgi:L-ascorbate 6-phosphate lactonase